jgi:hypothetical protein
MSIRARMPGPLRLLFQAPTGTADVSDQPHEPLADPIVELTVFASDSVAFGRIALTAHRVTDLLNDHTDFEFVDTVVQSLDDAHGLALRTVVIAQAEILAVSVAGPRGDPTRRTRTRPMPVELRVGRYEVSGNIHVVPGTDPLVGFQRRRVMVPLTEATIEFESPAGRVTSRFGTLIVNRDLTDWIAPARHADVRPPEVAGQEDGFGLVREFMPLQRLREA